MEKDKNHMTERILSVALEIIYLLIEEDYVIVKKSGDHVVYNSNTPSPDTVAPPHSPKHERNNEQKILELTNKMIQLLTGEEGEYLEGHNYLENELDFKGYRDDKRQKMVANQKPNSQVFTAVRAEPTQSRPTSFPMYRVTKERGVVTVRPHEISLNLYQDGTRRSVSTAPREDGHLPEIYIHVPIDQTAYLSVCNKGAVAPGTPDHFMSSDICKAPPAHSVENPVPCEEGRSTTLKQNQADYTAIKIKEEPIDWEEGSLPSVDAAHVVEQLLNEAKSTPPLHKKSLTDVTDHTQAQLISTPVKQEPAPYEEGTLAEMDTTPSAERQILPAHIKEESAPCADGIFTDLDMGVEHSPTPHTSECLKQEFCDHPCSEDESMERGDEEMSPPPSFHQSPQEEISSEYYSAHSSTGQQKPGPREKPFSCSECGKCFKYNSLLMHHAKSHQKKPLVCCDCGKQYSCKTEFDIHQRIHTGEKPFICSDCGKGFRRKSHMLRHQRIHGDKEVFACPECGKCFHRLDVLNQHRKIHKTNPSGSEAYVPTERCQTQNPSTAYEEKEVFACTECGTCYNEKSQLDRHQRIHTGDKPFSCTECGKSFRFEALLELHWGSHIATISCPECGKNFASQSLLNHHLKSHAGADDCVCAECGKEFPSRSQLVDHYRTHTGEKPYMCPDCGKHFRRKAHVVRHRKIHTGSKPFSCLECGKCFESREFLNRHVKMHKRKRPYSCSQCGKSYTKKSHLARHQRTHSRDTPYTCSECGECFQYPTLLSQHLKTHTGKGAYECSECGKTCNSDLSLVQHKKMHSKEKSFICVECGKSFTFYSHFVRHQTTHTGEKPYECLECGKRFTRDSHLVRHRQIHKSE